MNDDPTALARRVTRAAAVSGQLPVLVLYHRPGRDCGSYSAGGAGEQSSYLAWVRTVADAIADRVAVITGGASGLGLATARRLAARSSPRPAARRTGRLEPR